MRIRKRLKLVYGVGVNDADYSIGGSTRCPYYARWKHMLARCYCPKFQECNPAYKGCSVCDEWLLFSNFKKWMMAQDWQGKHLDKDLIKEGNKIYYPGACTFVDPHINTLLGDCKSARGDHPVGVSFRKDLGMYQAHCSNGKTGKDSARINIGTYDTEDEARKAYLTVKSHIIFSAAREQSDSRVAHTLNVRAKKMLIEAL